MKLSKKVSNIIIFCMLMLFICAAFVAGGDYNYKGTPISKEKKEKFKQYENERLNSEFIEQDQSQIPVKIYDENGVLLLETNSEFYIKHQEEIDVLYEAYKQGKCSIPLPIND
ncbi:hypothetical protein [Thermosyntropha sp.]|uniref:hypothetical protein n=1 Tax=Thermosyntropha sp. TaxID=2740820 RepID=UPI0025F5128E|nr:hypothetical protein [Thermosyntropha sp.]MBO8158930.1 hypothetical protein [Thermosyntropha sp.]